MKTFKKIGAFLLALMVSLSSLSLSVFAEVAHEHDSKEVAPSALSDTTTDAKCGEGTKKNVALGAEVIGDRGPGTTLGEVFWSVFDHYDCAVDGDPDTFCVLDTTHWKAYGLWVTLDDSYNLSSLEIQTNGIGRAPTSKGSTDLVIDRKGEFPFTVTLYDINGNQVSSYNVSSRDKENVVINLDDVTTRVYKIYIYVAEQYVKNGPFQGIWEVYAYSNDVHNWEITDEIQAPTCDDNGINAVKCKDCGTQKEGPVAHIEHTDTCKGYCDTCGTWIDVHHKGADGCLSTECVKCGASMTSTEHTKNASDPCDSSCVKCGVENAFEATHVYDVTQPCNNDCVKCGAKDVIPDAYDLGARITRTDWVLPYTYAPHVASTTDPCSTTCASCGKPDSVRAAHVLPADPCKDTKCGNAECWSNQPTYVGEGVFAHYRQGNLINEPHVRPTIIYGQVSPETNTYACRFSCAKGCGWVLSYAHEFDNCGDTVCNICEGGSNSTINIHERAHHFTAESPIVCVDCGTAMKGYAKVCEEHTYDNVCDAVCNTAGCGYQRYNQRTGAIDFWHIYENSCDTTCNDCNATRTIEHKYPEADCGELCTVCGEKRETTKEHTYSNVVRNGKEIENSVDCDEYCDACNEQRVVEHSYAYVCAEICSICKAEHIGFEALHTWSSACDNTCNNTGCDATRNVSHEYDNACDTTCNVEGCGFVRETTHQYSSVCDTTCNIDGCGFVREASKHSYANACDATCNNTGCTHKRTAEDDPEFNPNHAFDNACDTICNVCNLARVVGDHVYDNDCDNICNECNTKQRNNAHTYGAYHVTKEPTEESEGEQVRECVKCGTPDTPQALPKLEDKGLSTGAIVGIVSGSVVVVGGGGFSLWWFVIRKKFSH